MDTFRRIQRDPAIMGGKPCIRGPRVTVGMIFGMLGGTHPRARRQGVAAYLMQAQHDHVRSLGYRSIVTRTRASNRPMIILNLKSGFEIVGFEINAAGFAVVNQRKSLIAT